jgi:hypothetical protein
MKFMHGRFGVLLGVVMTFVLAFGGCDSGLFESVQETVEADQAAAAGIQAPEPNLFHTGSTTNEVTPQLSWTEVSGAVHYQVEWSVNEDFEGKTVSDPILASVFEISDPLNDGTYYWRVRAWDGEEWSDWSDTVSFTVARIPGKPVNLIPGDGSETLETSPEFSWDAVDGASRYRLTIHSDAGFVGAPVYQKDDVAAGSSPYHKVPSQTLDDGQVYYWRVEAEIDGDYWGEEASDDHTLTVDIEQAGLVSPTSATSDRTPRFEWAEVSGATDYHVLVYENDALIWDRFTPNLYYDMDQDLPDDPGPYEWEVTVRNSDGVEGDWDGARGSFGYRNITITSPNGGEYLDIGYNSTITWVSTGVTDVRIEIERDIGGWEYIDGGALASTGTFTWLVTGDEDPGTKIRITDVDGVASDESAMAFSIERKHWCVDSTVSSSGDGGTWATAMKTIQEAISASRSGDDIWVKAGTYTSSGASLAVMKPDSSLLGGFAGTETVAADRDNRIVEDNLTLLDGTNVGSNIIVPSSNIVIDGFTMGNTANATDGSCINITMAGVTVTRCVFQNCVGNNSDGPAVTVYGAGNAIIRECVFRNNETTGSYGGAMDISGTVYLENCLFEANVIDGATGPGYGAALYAAGGPVTIVGCTFLSNRITGSSTSQLGGAIYADRCPITIKQTAFQSNDAYEGGAVYAEMGSGAAARIENCTFLSNDAEQNGGAVAVYNASNSEIITIVHCSFSNNDVTSGDAGGLYVKGSSEKAGVDVVNCIFYHNEAQGSLEQIAFEAGSDGSITYSAVEGGWPDTHDTNINVTTGDVDFEGYTSNLRLRSTSVCIDQGTDAGVSVDFDNKARDASPDMGAFEY